MRTVVSSAPPPIPQKRPLPSEQEDRDGLSAGHETAELELDPQPMGTFCSICFDDMPHGGARLSDDEVLCDVCVSATFEGAEKYDRSRRPPLALFARRDADGLVLRSELDDFKPGRTLQLLLSLRAGDELRCCGCIPSRHVRGRVGEFVGYDTRRHVAVLRLRPRGAVACVQMPLLRRPGDEEAKRHEAMLESLLALGACASTLTQCIATVTAAHTLCGGALLERAKQRVADLHARRRMHDTDSATNSDDSDDDHRATLAKRRLRPCAPSDGGGGGSSSSSGGGICTNAALQASLSAAERDVSGPRDELDEY
jgi:hypothetical protein